MFAFRCLIQNMVISHNQAHYSLTSLKRYEFANLRKTSINCGKPLPQFIAIDLWAKVCLIAVYLGETTSG